MENNKTTPGDFFLWLGALVSLYASVVAFLSLMFDYINYAYPDPLAYLGNAYSGPIPYEMASLIVFTPITLVLFWLIRRGIRNNPAKANLWVRRWGLYLTLFVAGVTIAIDLITLITTYLSGGLTTHFVLKVVLVLLVASAGLMHFIADLWGYWTKNPRYSLTIGIAIAVVAIATIGSGFIIVGTPGQARLETFDEQKVSDLQNIQYQIVSYWQSKDALPTTLTDLNDSISGFSVPVDPQNSDSYQYKVLPSKLGVGITESSGFTPFVEMPTFQLCATFNAISDGSVPAISEPMPATLSGGTISGDWWHAAGNTCFVRTIDPALYPVAK